MVYELMGQMAWTDSSEQWPDFSNEVRNMLQHLLLSSILLAAGVQNKSLANFCLYEVMLVGGCYT